MTQDIITLKKYNNISFFKFSDEDGDCYRVSDGGSHVRMFDDPAEANAHYYELMIPTCRPRLPFSKRLAESKAQQNETYWRERPEPCMGR